MSPVKAPIVRSRVIAEIYRGVAFPPDWIDKSAMLNLGMARDLLVSVAAMLDADLRPVALCWRIAQREERFVHLQSESAESDALLDELHRDLADESQHLGTGDLLATLFWIPGEFPPEQGKVVKRILIVPTRYGVNSVTGWNVPEATLVAKADTLLFMNRRADDNLAFPMPTTIEDMHQKLGSGDSNTMIILPGGTAIAADNNVNRKMAWLFGGILLLGALISAFLLNRR
jgi:hypothetical protein